MKYFKQFPEIHSRHLEPIVPDLKNEFSIANILPVHVLHQSKTGRVLLVHSKASKSKYALKYMYKWKLAKFGEEEGFLSMLHRFSRMNLIDNVVKYYCAVDSSTLVFFYMQFYQSGSLLFHMRRLKTLSEDVCKKIVS